MRRLRLRVVAAVAVLGAGAACSAVSDDAPPSPAAAAAADDGTASGATAPDAATSASSDAALAPDGAPKFTPAAIKVCPHGCDFELPSAAVASAKPGALVEVLAGSYQDCVTIHADGVTLRGVGGYAHLHTKVCDGKGVIVNYASGTRLERLEISDFANVEFNGAGIRHDATAKDLTVSDLFVHDGQLGLLSSSSDDTLVIEGTLFDKVGVSRPDGEISVPLFVGSSLKLKVRASRFMHAVAGASMIKSSARSTAITCSVIANLDGPDSYSIDLQRGNDFSLTNSVIEQSTLTQNKIMIGYGSSSFTPATGTTLEIRGNTFLNDADGGTFIAVFKGAPASFVVADNTFIGSGTLLAGAGGLGVNQQLAARPPAIGAYPALPSPGPCQ